jgi:hypothetical protein
MNERGLIYGRHLDGTLLPVEIAISKINVNGIIEFTAVIRDIEDRVRLMDLLQKRAVTDQLTGLRLVGTLRDGLYVVLAGRVS